MAYWVVYDWLGRGKKAPSNNNDRQDYAMHDSPYLQIQGLLNWIDHFYHVSMSNGAAIDRF